MFFFKYGRSYNTLSATAALAATTRAEVKQ